MYKWFRLFCHMVLFFFVMANCANAKTKPNAALDQTLAELGIKVASISPSEVSGLQKVISTDNQIFYVSKDNKYLLFANIFDLTNKDKTKWNVTERERSSLRAKLINQLKNLVSFKPKQAPLGRIYVFTDPSCVYCQRFHKEVDALLAGRIEVNYVAYPRGGKQSPGYDKLVSIWCNHDQNTSMTTVKAGGGIESKTCSNPIEEHMALGNKLGVTGTPAILFENGIMHPGYVPAAELIKLAIENSK